MACCLSLFLDEILSQSLGYLSDPRVFAENLFAKIVNSLHDGSRKEYPMPLSFFRGAWMLFRSISPPNVLRKALSLSLLKLQHFSVHDSLKYQA